MSLLNLYIRLYRIKTAFARVARLHAREGETGAKQGSAPAAFDLVRQILVSVDQIKDRTCLCRMIIRNAGQKPRFAVQGFDKLIGAVANGRKPSKLSKGTLGFAYYLVGILFRHGGPNYYRMITGTMRPGAITGTFQGRRNFINCRLNCDDIRKGARR